MEAAKPKVPGGALALAADASSARRRAGQRGRLFFGLSYALLLLVAFAKPLISLGVFAAASALNSHILLVPFISGYLIYLQREQLAGVPLRTSGWAAAPWLAGAVAWVAERSYAPVLSANDSLALMAFAFVAFIVAGGLAVLGWRWLAEAAFPVAFLMFMVPLPDGVVNGLETASKLASAEVADWMFDWAGLPVLRDGVVFQLPGIIIEVAQECSGIRSSWVLLITGLVASHLFLRSPWRKLLLVMLVIPLGVVRNGFRIMVIGLLCAHVGPHMIHSAIHKKGGPLFFAISLVPLFLLLSWLRKREGAGAAQRTKSRAVIAEAEAASALNSPPR